MGVAVQTPKQVADNWARAVAAKGEPIFPAFIDRDDEWRERYIESVKRLYVSGVIDLPALETRLDWAFAGA